MVISCTLWVMVPHWVIWTRPPLDGPSLTFTLTLTLSITHYQGSPSEQLRHLRVALASALQGVPLNVCVLQPGCFIHIGWLRARVRVRVRVRVSVRVRVRVIS